MTTNYNLTLQKGAIKVRNGIFTGSSTEAVWSPVNPNENGGWKDADTVTVVCTFNLNPNISPQPSSNNYAGLCVGACSDQDKTGINFLIKQAQGIFVPNPGQLLTYGAPSTITEDSTPADGNIFYGAQSTVGTFSLTPSSRGILTNYIYQWQLIYNGSNLVAPNGNVELVFGYGDPQFSDTDS